MSTTARRHHIGAKSSHIGIGVSLIFIGYALDPLKGWLENQIGTNNASLIWLVTFGLFLGIHNLFVHYIAILGGSGEENEKLRHSIATGGTPARLYMGLLKRGLHKVELFMGDLGMDSQRMFGLNRPHSLWTAPSLDRCILLAFIFPEASLLLIWLATGKVGDAESVIGLIPVSRALRMVVLAGFLLAAFGYMRCYRLVTKGKKETRAHGQSGAASKPTMRWQEILLWFVFALSFGSLLMSSVIGGSGGAVIGSAGLAGEVVGAVSGDAIVALATALSGALGGAFVAARFGVQSAAGPTVAAIVGAGVGLLWSATAHRWEDRVRDRLRHSVTGLLLFLAFITVACFLATWMLSPERAWPMAGPAILFYGLLAVLNAPFVWVSLGLTRALLWRGQELGGWWPYFFALADACAAVLLIIVMAIGMVFAIQLMGYVALISGGTPVLKVEYLLSGMAKNPGSPEYWWVYAMLISTMIPSMINLTIGGMALTRGVPVVSRSLCRALSPGKAVSEHVRNRIAAILTCQWVLGICLAFAAQAFLVWGLFGYFLPQVGTSLLELARLFAAQDRAHELIQLIL